MKQILTNNADFFIFKRFKLSIIFLFSSLTFFRHSDDLKINTFLYLQQIDVIVEESSHLIQIGSALFRPGGLYGPPQKFLSITLRAFEILL